MEDTESPNVWPQLVPKNQKLSKRKNLSNIWKKKKKKVIDTNTQVHQEVGFPRGDRHPIKHCNL